jgi:hypothetical protein
MLQGPEHAGSTYCDVFRGVPIILHRFAEYDSIEIASRYPSP